MNAQQLDLTSLKTAGHTCSRRRPQRRVHDSRARLWFHEMRRIVEATPEWTPEPSPVGTLALPLPAPAVAVA